MPNILQAQSGQTNQVDSIAGPGSYESGDGFSITTNLGRVDEATAEIDNSTWDARATGVADNNTVVVSVFSSDSAGEAPQDTDLSGDEITYSASRL